MTSKHEQKIVLIGRLEDVNKIVKFWHYFNAEPACVIDAARYVDSALADVRLVAKDRTYRECNRDDADATYHGFDASAISFIIKLTGVDDAMFNRQLINLIEQQPYLGSVCRINLSNPPGLLPDPCAVFERLTRELTSEIIRDDHHSLVDGNSTHV